jgi:hypothetical protein
MQWLNSGLNFLKGLPTNVYLGLAAVALLAASFGTGYLVGSRNEARIQIERVEERVYVPVKEIQEVQVRNVERERQYQQQRDVARQEAARLREALQAVPDSSRTVTLDSRTVQLLNEAIANGAPASPTGEPPREGATIAVSDLIDWAARATEQYNGTATQLNELIDWVEDELIEPQRTGDQVPD